MTAAKNSPALFLLRAALLRAELLTCKQERVFVLFVPDLSLSSIIPLPPPFPRTTHRITQARGAPSRRGSVDGAGEARGVPAGRRSVAGAGGARDVACHLLVCACPPAPGEQSDKQVVISSGRRPRELRKARAGAHARTHKLMHTHTNTHQHTQTHS